MHRPQDQKALSHCARFLLWLLSNNLRSVLVFFFGFYLEILHSLCLCQFALDDPRICLRSACVTITPSHPRAETSGRGVRQRAMTHSGALRARPGQAELFVGWRRSEKPPDVQHVTQRTVLSPGAAGEPGGHTSNTLVCECVWAALYRSLLDGRQRNCIRCFLVSCYFAHTMFTIRPKAGTNNYNPLIINCFTYGTNESNAFHFRGSNHLFTTDCYTSNLL